MITNDPSTEETPLTAEPVSTPEAERQAPWIKLLIAIVTWFSSVLLLLFVPAIIAIPYLVYRWKTHSLPNVQALTTDKTFIFISIAGVVPTHLLTLLLVWLVVTEGRKLPFWKTIGFEWPKSISPLIGTAACFLIAVALLVIGFAVTSFWGGGKTQLDMLVESSIASRFATAFVAVFTAPLVEELVYRGVVYSAIERTLGVGVAFAAVALLFAGVHVFQYINNISVITVITVLSITLTGVRAYTGKVLPSFVIHLVFNGIQSIIIALSPFTGWGGSS